MLTDIRWLISSARRYSRLYVLSVLCTLGSGVTGLIDPLIMKWVIDEAVPSGKIAFLPLAGGVFVLAYAGRVLLGVQGTQLGAQAAQRLSVRLRFKTLRHLQCQSSAFYDDVSPGEFAFRLEQDVEQIAQSGDELFSSSFQSSIFFVLNLAAMFMLNAGLAMVILPLIPIFAFVRYRYYRRARQLSAKVQSALATRSSFLQERLPAVVQSQLLRNEHVQARDFLTVARRAMDAHLARQKMETLYSGLSLLTMALGFGVMLTFGGYQVITGILTVGGLVAFWGYLMRLFEPIAGLIDLDTKLQRIRASIQRVREVLETRSAIEDPIPPINLISLEPATIQFYNVSFTYAGGRVGVEAVSFALDAGQRVAIVGKTGSGKSTITKLIARLYDVQKGSVEVDRYDIRTLALGSLRSSVLLVPQDPIFFDGSFRDNLVCGCPKITFREMQEVIETTELDTVLSAFARGWDEQLGPRATKLSGGERQRLALARALLRKPRALILDECTSALDGSTEDRVLRNLAASGGRITLLLVTHNPVVMNWVDRVIMLADGCVVAEGSHHQLSRHSRIYQDICADQFLAPRRLSHQLLPTKA